MKKTVIFLLFLGVTFNVFVNSVQAQANTKTLLYLYSSDCGYCIKFNPIYKKISEAFAGKCNFKKVDARTAEGQRLMQKYNGVFVPYVLIIDDEKNYKAYLTPNCILSYACTSSAVENFVKK